MPPTTFTVDNTTANLADLLALVQAGTEVIIAKDGKPLARVVPVVGRPRRIAGLNHGSIDTTDDFDAPLPDEFWLGDE